MKTPTTDRVIYEMNSINEHHQHLPILAYHTTLEHELEHDLSTITTTPHVNAIKNPMKK